MQSAEDSLAIVNRIIIMPLISIGMREDDDIGKLVVIVEDVRQVHHAFSSLVPGHSQGCVRIVGDEDELSPIDKRIF